MFWTVSVSPDGHASLFVEPDSVTQYPQNDLNVGQPAFCCGPWPNQ
jgi:hypothetical protein